MQMKIPMILIMHKIPMTLTLYFLLNSAQQQDLKLIYLMMKSKNFNFQQIFRSNFSPQFFNFKMNSNFSNKLLNLSVIWIKISLKVFWPSLQRTYDKYSKKILRQSELDFKYHKKWKNLSKIHLHMMVMMKKIRITIMFKMQE